MEFHKNLLIYPMAFYAFYMFGTAVYMFRMRVRALKSKEVSMKYFKSYASDTPAPPEYAKIAERHYENQFEVPTLFFSTGIMHFSLGMANSLTLGLLWLFVVSRVLHTYIHVGSNNIRFRMPFYTLGWFALLALWAQMVYLVY
jgi:hypothetical protein